MHILPSRFVLLGIGLLTLWSFKTNLPHNNDLSPALSPVEELATFQVEPGLQVQLVAAEPLVQAPILMNFDAEGRLWVVEMRGYMSTIDGADEKKPNGRVSVLEDRNGDGQMDVSTVYLDSLLMPRALAFAPGGVLVVENGALWLTKDTNSDLKADTKTLIDKDYAGSALPEHAGNGLWRGMDNWYYNAKSRFRYRFNADGTWQRDSTEFRGQWGISHDDRGRLLYNYNWSQLHGDLVPPNMLSRNPHHTPSTGIDHGFSIDRRIYPLRSTRAVNRGYIPGTLDKQGRIQEFTAACSPLAYRETTLPTEYRGDIFVCEPAGNLIKRNKITPDGPILNGADPHPGREFLASTDERFRPTSLAGGPDGALYVVDMYRGIIQHAAYMTPYLKEQTLARKLVEPVNRGRIWRIVPTNNPAPKSTKLASASPDALLAALSGTNGWHRDMAQRLLVERGSVDVVPKLAQIALTGANPYGRAQALWTLDGLNQRKPDLLLKFLNDKDPFVQSTAMRLLAPLTKQDRALAGAVQKQYAGAVSQASSDVALHMALTLPTANVPAAFPIFSTILEKHGDMPLIRDAVMSNLRDNEFAFFSYLRTARNWQTATPAREIFLEMLTTAIARKRNAAELAKLNALLKTPTGQPGWREKAALSGLKMGGATDKASGQSATAAKANPLSADDQKLFAKGRQLYLATCSGCHGTDGMGMARFAPPLSNSHWVTGDAKRLALIMLHGMEGPVDVAGKVYNAPDILPVMPAHSTLDDASIAAILTYIRNEWGNQAGPLDRKTVGMTRVLSQGRVVPWTAKDLEEYMAQQAKDAPKSN
ncbi:MAG: dehydrogenase [Cytophagales bacterium]|nr:MAG: dehydrogenase [Cytophagales bacterium]